MDLNADPNESCLRVPSDPGSLTTVRQHVDAAARRADLNDKAREQIVLAVSEACENIIRHAHEDRTELPITIACHIVDDGLQVQLHDQGRPFDFDAEPELDPTDSRRGGRGLFLIRRLADRVSFRALPEGGNELQLFKRADPGN